MRHGWPTEVKDMAFQPYTNDILVRKSQQLVYNNLLQLRIYFEPGLIKNRLSV